MAEIITEISYRPRGGQNGIEVTVEQQSAFAKFVGETLYRDKYIPLPDLNNLEQKKRIDKGCTHEKDMHYWENDQGGHGWCCAYCGTVVQWG